MKEFNKDLGRICSVVMISSIILGTITNKITVFYGAIILCVLLIVVAYLSYIGVKFLMDVHK